MRFDFVTASRIIFERGCIQRAGLIASGMGRRAFVVTGGGSAVPQKVYDVLQEAGVPFEAFPVVGEPSVHTAWQGVQMARKSGCDFVIGFGGGSVLDTAKAVAAMLTNPGDILDYLEVVGQNLPLLKKAAATLAIPTTAGTGTEVTRNAVLAVPEKRVKVSLRSPLILPSVALVDPELTLTAPPEVTARSGMDAFTQVIEPYVSRNANVMTDLFCREGMQRAARSLLKAYQQPDHFEAREDMAWASLLGGLALTNAGLGAVHGFAGPIGGMFDAPHGVICARLLPFVTAANIGAMRRREPAHPVLARYDEIARILTQQPHARAEDAIAWLKSLIDALHIPPLSQFGLTAKDFPQVIDKAMAASSMKGNPIQLTYEELAAVLEQAL